MTKKQLLFILLFLCFASYGVFEAYQLIRTPKISVVMPTFNKGSLVKRAVNSILNQTFKDFELIIIDDASTDESVQDLITLAKQDKRIRLIRNQEQKGISYARNLGNSLAKGKYIAIMDSDDESLLNRLEKSFEFMEKNPHITAMSADIIPDSDTINQPIASRSFNYTLDSHFFMSELFFKNTFYNVPAIFRADFVKKNHIRYNEEYIAAEDYDFWKQIILAGGKLAKLKDVLVKVYFHNSNSSQYYYATTTNSLKVREDLFNHLFETDNFQSKIVFPLEMKCTLLQKMTQANKKTHLLPAWDIEAFKKEYCPTDQETGFYLSHPKWEDFFAYQNAHHYIAHKTKEKALITKKGDKLIVTKENQKPETFLFLEGNTYSLISDHILKLKHKYWTDTISLFEKNKFCRTSEAYECGILIRHGKNRIELNWNNTNYKHEFFELKGDTYYQVDNFKK